MMNRTDVNIHVSPSSFQDVEEVARYSTALSVSLLSTIFSTYNTSLCRPLCCFWIKSSERCPAWHLEKIGAVRFSNKMSDYHFTHLSTRYRIL